MKTSDALIQEPCYFKFLNPELNGKRIIYEEEKSIVIFQIKSIIEDYLRQLASENAFIYHNSTIILSHFLDYIKIFSQNSK